MSKLRRAVKRMGPVAPLIAPAVHSVRHTFAGAANMLFGRVSGPVPAKAVTTATGHCFFGYYDKSPWDETGRYLLCLKTDFARRMPQAGERATICVVDLENDNALQEIASTTAWCWQQGCMLQWWRHSDRQSILYNDYRDGQYVTMCSDLEGNVRDQLSLPTYAVSRDGRMALSLNFARLHHCRPGYGYVAGPAAGQMEACPGDDGIFLADTATGENRLIVSLHQMAQLGPGKDRVDSIHYVNHLQFNPGGNRFVFFHRWRPMAGGKAWTRMYTAAPDGSDLFCLSDHGMVSHYAWRDDRHILAWAEHPTAGRRYYLLEDKTDRVSVVGEGALTQDGHPSYSGDGRWILTDTYPDYWRRRRSLILYDTVRSQRHDLGQFFVPKGFEGPLRCDLHPRWRSDGSQICFDSVHEGSRRVYLMDITPEFLDSLAGNQETGDA